MDKSEFDKFAAEYHSVLEKGIGASGEGPEYFAEYKIRDIALEHSRVSKSASSDLRILDFGSGIGESVPYVQRHFRGAKLQCIDPSERSLDVARGRNPDGATYRAFDGQTIPFADDVFDIAYSSCVFHHIPEAEHVGLLRELKRVLVPGGLLLIFEHNPFNPLTVRVVNNCPFDENAVLIKPALLSSRFSQAGFPEPRVVHRVFFPHALRFMRPLEKFLRWLPLGGQYYVVARK